MSGQKMLWMLLGVIYAVSGAELEYNNRAIRGIISALCTTPDFANSFLVKISGKCPSGVQKDLTSCGISCALEKDKEGALSKFQLEAREHINLYKDQNDEVYIHVDLRQIVERYTGYKDGRVVWNALHKICDQDPILKRLAQGIHTSINIHLSAFYNDDPNTRPLYMNYKLMRERTSNPEYVNSLKFTLDFMLSLLPIAIPSIQMAVKSPDAMYFLSQLINSLSPLQYSYSQYPFSSETVSRVDMLPDLVACVSCMRCKVWGRVQLEGLKCAIKLLASTRNVNIPITRTEIIFFINLINKLSTSVLQYQKYILDSSRTSALQVNKEQMVSKIISTAYTAVATPFLLSKPDTHKKRMCSL
ncbi:ERO1-like protein alpha [Nematocida sp. AWRm80]|nr:ERO1-like protein alpha [Nematocida sp. AWRm80]